MKKYSDEESCKRERKKYRDQVGVICPHCGSKDHYWKGDKECYECKKCKYRQSLRSNTVMHGSQLPFHYWFIAIQMLTYTKKSISAKELQRQLAKKANVIMDGRDIGTTVLPDAFCKIYLTASVDARAKRRFDELSAKNEPCSYETIKADIEERDYQDMHREISPLKQAEDAVLVDTSEMTVDEVVDHIEQIIKERQ